MKPKIVEDILISEEAIQKKIRELGRKISKDYSGKKLVIVAIMRGAMLFLADLVRHISVPAAIDFMFVTSYKKASKSSGAIRIIKDLKEDIEDKYVLIVEDIVDTGLTFSYLKKYLKAHNPKSIKICTLLDKPSRRLIKVKPNYVGFTIPDEFVVGYGLDYLELYRNLPYIATLTDKAKERLK
ncbi:hypoxanthine phosphoribosyltransferase [bacterium]|nr:hypoxanthine phosphoribosyltransferase [bacterium]MBU4310189.1 hypoxanthine phosphoribosyltransferase [bacterium]MBU4561368.1 hypoxanthine phosphoribosyltransferase [bacterium]MCG2675811.1 hypoxanthine phosphoribosyltransferase [bacterium]MCG2678290.1 hypoxanthine phosphoribosyltransferase [bacterium]